MELGDLQRVEFCRQQIPGFSFSPNLELIYLFLFDFPTSLRCCYFPDIYASLGNPEKHEQTVDCRVSGMSLRLDI